MIKKSDNEFSFLLIPMQFCEICTLNHHCLSIIIILGGPSRTTAQKLRGTPMSSGRPLWRGLPTLPRPPIQAGQSQGRSFLSNTWACPLKLRTRPPTSSATEEALCYHHQSPKFLSPKQTRPLPAWRPRCSETPSHH